jgi:signal transduction histidine kinase/streptogramin lyase
LGDNSIRAICEDANGTLRVATRRGLSSLNADGSFSTISLAAGMVGNALRCVEVDRQGRIWAGSNEGLNCLDGERRTFYSSSDGLPDRITTVLYKDRRGELWVGTYSGLASIVDQKIVSQPMNEGVPGDRIYAIYQDREDNLWVGSWDGLCRITPARFTTYSTQQGLNCNNVMSVYEDRAGTVWLGTWGGGLNELREGKFFNYGATNGLTHDLVLSLHEGRDQSLWVGMEFGGGLNRLQEARQNSHTNQAGLTDAAIRVVHEDRKGTLWLGTSLGIKTLKNGHLNTYNTAQGLAGNVVMAICEDQTGRLWFGTDGGLSRWDDGAFTNYTTRDGLSHNGVNAIYEDGNGVLWLGTKGGGLNRFQDGKFTAYTSRQGLFSDEVYEVLEDDAGFFWMSCRKGIFRVSRRELDAFDRGEVETINCIAYGKADGLVSVQCNGVAKPAGWKGREGRLWFPTIRGAVAVDSRIATNLRPPPVVIEEIVADQFTLRPSSSTGPDFGILTVPPGRGELEIRFTALSFQAPEKNRFRYQLDGVDRDWVDGDTSRAVRYNNVAPGEYQFRVTASNNDGVWNTTGATILLVYEPHFWQTLWFKLAIFAAMGLLLTAFYRARVKRLRAIENLRVQIAADLHDDVGSRLTKVAMVTEHVDAETAVDDRNKPLIRSIAGTTREIIQAMDEIVWTINPKNDTLENLANYIFQYAQDFFQGSNVRCRLDLPARLPELKLSTQERHNLFMAVKEALHNVLKHSQATEVRIRLVSTGGRLIINVADNGRGFATDPAPDSGNGLNNMRQRLERIGGRLSLESRPGHGTEIKMEAEGG